MFKRKELLIALIVMMAVPITLAQFPDLPPGPMQAKVKTACLECHESRIILQQRLSKKLWAREVDKMIKWGAVVETSDRDAIIDYLSVNLGTDKAPDAEQFVAPDKKH